MFCNFPVDGETQGTPLLSAPPPFISSLIIGHIFQNQPFCTMTFPLKGKALPPSRKQNTGTLSTILPTIVVMLSCLLLL